MTLVRPEVSEVLRKGQEVIAAAGILAFGLWLIWLGGLVLMPLGLLVAALAAILARQAWRRMRFTQTVAAPGMVELDEAQVGYLGPGEGGFLSLKELVELRILRVQGRRMWRLKQADGQALLIPVDAQGADRLFDAFATLPGMDTGALVAALDPAPAGPGLAEARVVWRRPAWAGLRASPGRARPGAAP
jgi:hypothetical protein